MITTMTVPYLMFQWLLLFMVTFVNFSSNIVTIRLNGKGDPVMMEENHPMTISSKFSSS